MNQQQHDPTGAELDRLAQDYRAIKAPPHLKTRITAEARVQESRRGRQRWRPVAAGLALALGLLAVTPLLKQEPGSETDGSPPLPSLAAAAR